MVFRAPREELNPNSRKTPPKTAFPDDELSTRATVPIANRYSAYYNYITYGVLSQSPGYVQVIQQQ